MKLCFLESLLCILVLFAYVLGLHSWFGDNVSSFFILTYTAALFATQEYIWARRLTVTMMYIWAIYSLQNMVAPFLFSIELVIFFLC